jgi:hypothetical protein
MKNFRRKRFLGGLVVLIVFAAAAAVTMLLWNALLPAIIAGVSAISYWQAAGLMLLARLLFGGFGHAKHTFAAGHHHAHEHRERMGDWMDMHRKMRNMSHDDRIEFIRKRMTEKDDEGK